MDWLEEMTAAIAEAAGLESAELQLPVAVRDEILDLARIASHASGERINAPLLCYALGIAVASGRADLEALARTIRSRTNA